VKVNYLNGERESERKTECEREDLVDIHAAPPRCSRDTYPESYNEKDINDELMMMGTWSTYMRLHPSESPPMFVAKCSCARERVLY